MGTEYSSSYGKRRWEANPNEPVYPVPADPEQTTKETETGNQPELNTVFSVRAALDY
jgi:hypothetical protein